MPELPEIEVLRQSLEPLLVGRRIERVDVSQPALREPVNVRSLKRRAKGEVTSLRRRAKYLLVDLAGTSSTVVIHLGMSGRLTLADEGEAPELHEHVSFTLDGRQRLRFRDPRRFGMVVALPTKGLAEDRHFRHLGIEPLGDELNGKTLALLAKGRRAPVKQFLMDGRRVVGVGNIYASEALFRSGIDPRRSVARISLKRWERLSEAVRFVLAKAIREGGTTLNDFADGLGESGYFQVSLEAYGRDGEACSRCDRPIRRIVQGGRSTFFCPKCQR